MRWRQRCWCAVCLCVCACARECVALGKERVGTWWSGESRRRGMGRADVAGGADVPPPPPLPCPQHYHSMADRLALIPATAKRAEGVAFEVRLDRGGRLRL